MPILRSAGPRAAVETAVREAAEAEAKAAVAMEEVEKTAAAVGQ